ncbi:MAG: VOC family protein [Bryobacterales bacterium]|nr:VOC family protein [Bryobacterales bacterium]
MRWFPFLSLLVCPVMAQLAPPNAAGVSMGHLHIITPDPEAQRRAWIDVTGGRPVMVGPLEFAMFPGLVVGFRKGDSAGGTDGSVIDHVGFLVPDLAAMKARVLAGRLAIVSENPKTRQFFAMFPDGVKVEFSEERALNVPIRFHHIHFASNQVEAMRAWYGEHFDAVPGMRSHFKAADLPGVNLSWNAAGRPPAATVGRALDHIGFEVRDLKAFAKRLEAAGLKLDMPVTERPDLGLSIAFLTDAWGTRIELTEGLDRVR